MTKKYSWTVTHDTWTVTYNLDVDFKEIYEYELYGLRSKDKLDEWAISNACERYFAGMDDEIYYNLNEDVKNKVKKDFIAWLKKKFD